MTEITNKIYNLEDRTLEFAKAVIRLANKLPKILVNIELIRQVCRSAASIGANYREANEALGKKDFIYRISISRKETKETTYWLELILEANPDFKPYVEPLLQESKELRNIFTSIINKSK